MPESVNSETETVTKLKKASKDVIEYLTTLGTLDLASLSKEAEEERVKLRQQLIEILSDSPDGLVNGDEANGSSAADVVAEDIEAEDYEVPTSTLQRNAKLVEPDRTSTTSIEKKAERKGMSNSKSMEMKKKKGLTRMKSSQVVELPNKDARKKEGNLIEKKLMRRTTYWAILGPDTLYLARSSEETQSEFKIRLLSASVNAQKNMREFMVKRQGKSYLLRAESDEDCQVWMEQIQQCIDDVNEQDCQFSDEDEDVPPPVNAAVEATSDKTSLEPDAALEPDEELYENDEDTPKVDENEVDGDNDDVYDDVEAPPVATPSALLTEPDRSESVSSAASNTSTSKRVSIFGGKNKDGLPSEGKLSGFIQKKGKFSWDKKWFILADQTLYYSNSDTDKKCQGTLLLAGASIDTKPLGRPFTINIKQKSNKMLLGWDDSQIYNDWLKAIKSAAGDDQSSEPSEKDLKVEENGEGEKEEEEAGEADEAQEDYVNPDLNDAEVNGDEVYDDVVAEPLKSDTKPEPLKSDTKPEPLKSDTKPEPVPQKLPTVKKPIRGGGKSELKDPEHSGYLHRKTTGIIKKWERKWFFIVDKTLYMSTTEEEESYKNLLTLSVVSEVVKGSIEKQYPYGITLQLKPSCGKDIILAAETKEEQSLWVAKLNAECDVFNCELSSDEEDGAYLHKAPAPAPEPQVPQVPQVTQAEETVRVDDQGFIMEDIYEDVSQPLDAPPEPPPPNKEPPKTDASAPSLPPRNPNAKLSTPVPSVPTLPPRNQPATPNKPSPAPAEPEPIMDEFYEDMDELKAQYENAKSIMDHKSDMDEEPPATKKTLTLPPKADTDKKSPLLKKKELKKEKEQQKKEAKKKEKENKKLKKDKEKSKSLTPKTKSTKSGELKADDVGARSQSFSATASKPPEDDEEYVIEELTANDEKTNKVDEPEPIDEEIYEDVEEPPPPLSPPATTTTPSTLIKKPSPPPASTSTSNKSPASSLPRSAAFSPPGKVSDFKRGSSPVTEPPRSQSVSPSNVKIRTTGITVSSISKPKPPTSVTPVTTTTSSTSSVTSSEEAASTTSTTSTTSVKTTVSKPVTSSALNRPRVKVSEAIYKFQKRSSTADAVLHSGKLFHKAPGRTRFRQEYCEIIGTVMSFYREKGDERAMGTLSLEECELHVVKEQYEGRRYVFSLAAGSATDMLSPELQVELDKWLSMLEPLVKKYVKEE